MRVAFVTGSSRGIGRGIADLLTEHDWTVIYSGTRRERPEQLPEDFSTIADEEGLERAVCDYISGMTDDYAMEVYDKLFIPASWSIK